MQALIYADLAKKKATDSIGGSAFKFPTLSYGEDLTLALRFTERANSETSEVSLNVRELRASIGKVDARPESGKIKIKVGDDTAADGTNVTAAIDHKASAIQVQSALNALSVVGAGATYGEASVEEKGGSWMITFDGEEEAVPLSVTYNSLFPLTFFRVRASEFNGQWVHDARLIQAPVASTDQSERVVPPPPTVTTLEDGGSTEEGGEWPEVQKLYVPPAFRGVYQIRRGFKKTGMLDRTDDEVNVAEALNDALTDEDDELFVVSLPEDNTMHITFDGSLIGIDHDPLEIEVFDAPEGDLTFTLSLNTPELHTLLRKNEKVTLPIEIEADIEDPNDSSLVYTRKLVKEAVTIERELHYEELSTVASVDWQRPPLPKSYVPFTTDQVSNGQIHYATADFGNGSAGPYVFDHNLDTPRIDVTVYPNTSLGEPLKHGTLAEVAAGQADFGFERKSDNSVEVTFATGKEPAYNDYLITILGLEQTSFFDAHTHAIEQIVGLRSLLDDLGKRVGDLERRTGGDGRIRATDLQSGQAAHWQLPPLFEVFPTKRTIAGPDERLIDLDTTQLGRSKGLLPAVHDASVESMTSALSISSEYPGRVFQNTSESTILLPGGKGLPSPKIKPNAFAACDGRLWYEVTRYGEHAEAITFTTDFADDENRLSATDNEFPNGTVVTLDTDGTLPAPLVTGTEYTVLNREDDSVELTTVGGSEPIILASNGTGNHTLTKKVETSYYPKEFERELFRIPVNERQLRLRSRFELRFALELAVLKANTAAQWALAIEVGQKTSVTTPSRTGKNIESIVWRGSPLLEQEIVISPVSTVHRFGALIDRALVDGEDTLTATGLAYGGTEGAVAPKNPNFILRARLIRFDTEDGESAPTGFVAMKGFTIETPDFDTPTSEGTAFIK